MDLRELYQEVIVDHNRDPRNFHTMAEPCRCVNGFNPLCGDKITLFVKVNDDEVIEQASFQGRGCAISTASASLMTDALKGMSVTDAKKLFESFHEMLTSSTDELPKQIKKLAVFSGVREYPARVKCATLAWHTLMAALNETTDQVTTE